MPTPAHLQVEAPPPAAPAPEPGAHRVHWTAGTVVLSIFLFVLAGFAEISGGWMIWQSIRVARPFWYAIIGAVVLCIYGFIPTAQPTADFGRIYAVYGGFFILLSYAWGWAVDGNRPDTGDYVGTGLAIGGVSLAWFWPR